MIFKRPPTESDELTLKVGDQAYRFDSLADFEFALSGRTCVPSEKITALVSAPDDDLLEEAAGIEQAEQRLREVLDGVLDDSDNIDDVLKEVDLALIFHDNDWRAVISALMPMPASFGAFKKVALVKYMEYLASRHETLKGVYQHRQIHKQESAAPENDPGSAQASPKETAVFEMSPVGAGEDQSQFGRLPKGETLEVPLEADDAFSLMISRHKCGIVIRGRMLFVDGAGRETTLREGENVVGRDSEADIVMEAALRDISRKHLVIECNGTNVVRVTDISSHGTWVHSRYLDRIGA